MITITILRDFPWMGTFYSAGAIHRVLPCVAEHFIRLYVARQTPIAVV